MRKKKYHAIMLVDDNDLDNLIHQKIIERVSICEYIYVHTGARGAIEFLRNMEKIKIANKILPNLIILDLDMPFMDGFQFLEEFSKLSPLVKKTCKVIILTSSKNTHDFEQSKKYKYVNLIIKKPLILDNIAKLNI